MRPHTCRQPPCSISFGSSALQPAGTAALAPGFCCKARRSPTIPATEGCDSSRTFSKGPRRYPAACRAPAAPKDPVKDALYLPSRFQPRRIAQTGNTPAFAKQCYPSCLSSMHPMGPAAAAIALLVLASLVTASVPPAGELLTRRGRPCLQRPGEAAIYLFALPH